MPRVDPSPSVTPGIDDISIEIGDGYNSDTQLSQDKARHEREKAVQPRQAGRTV